MSTQQTLPPTPAAPPPAAPGGNAPDARRLNLQLAALVEQGAGFPQVGELRPWLEFVRALLNATAVGVLPATNSPDAPNGISTTRALSAAAVAALPQTFQPGQAAAQPFPALGAEHYALGVPVARDDKPEAWLVAVLAVPNPRDLQAMLVLLQGIAGYLLYRSQRVEAQRFHSILDRVAGMLEIVRRSGSERDFSKAARLAVDDLCDYFGCARVCFGLRQLGGGIRLEAISGIGRVDGKSPTHQPVEAAMIEAIEHDARLDFFPETTRTPDNTAHEILARAVTATHLTTLPLPDGSGAVQLEWNADHAPSPETPRLLLAAAPFLPALFDLLRRARPNPTVFAAQRVWSRLSERRRTAVFVALAVLAALLACPFPYKISANCRIAAARQRVVSAPFQGLLLKSQFRPGELVAKDQTLVEMDNRELKLREAELAASREKALKQRDRALRNEGEGADFAAAQIAAFEADSVGEELELVRRKLALLEVKSPIAGTVVSGDLRRAEGQPVQQGQVLFEVAPLDEMIVEIEVPDRDISHVATGQNAAFRLEAFGGSWDASVARIHPQSEARDGKNIFVCEADLSGIEGLRPGMRGRATISTARRPLAWILGHKFVRWVIETLFW